MKSSLTPVLLILLTAGCVSLPPDYRLAAVQDDLSQRLETSISVEIETEFRRVESQRLTDRPLDSQAALALAFLNNPQVYAALAQYGVHQSEYLEMITIPNPLLAWEQLKPDGEHVIEAELSVHFLPILWGPKLRAIGQRALDAQLDQLALQMLKLRRQVLSAYYDHIADRQRLELFEQVVAATRSRTSLAERLRAAGNITARQLNQEHDLLVQADAQLAMARQAVQRSKRALNFALGDPGIDWRVPARLPKLPAKPKSSDPTKSLVSHSIEKQIDAQRQRWGLKRAKTGIDDLEIGITAEREGGEWDRGPLLEVQLPLFHQGQAQRQRAQHQLRQLEYQLSQARNASDRAFAQAQSNLDFARQMVVQHLDLVLPLRRKLYEQALADHNAMQIGFFDLALARQRQIEAGLSFISQLHNYWQADADIAHLRAGGNPIDISRSASDRPLSTTPGNRSLGEQH